MEIIDLRDKHCEALEPPFLEAAVEGELYKIKTI
jgi:hypothetical protein